jgi:hypothetical protein
MNKGCLIFAHNSKDLDYILMATIAGGLAKKYLNLPVSLVTDESTLAWAETSKIYDRVEEIFDKIILIERPIPTNFRKLHDGYHSKIVPFVNSTRASAYDLTPYDNTLLIDSDYLIFSDQLNNYWDLEYDIMLGRSMNEPLSNRAEILDKRLSEIGPHLYWATTLMFKKNDFSKLFFDLVSYIKENYKYYADLYRFDHRQYRNDISFSIAKHILNGFEESTIGSLPDITTILDCDLLYTLIDEKNMIFLVNDKHNPRNYFLTSIKDKDIHILNKQSLVRNKDYLLRLI